MTGHTLLLFDIDATLLNTGGAGLRAMRRVVQRLFEHDGLMDDVPTAGRLDPAIFADLARLAGVEDHDDHHHQFRDHYIGELRQELEAFRHEVEVLPGVTELLAMLRLRQRQRGDVTMGLLTGNYAAAAPLKLAAIGVDPAWFTVTAFGDDGATRPDLVAVALQRFEKQTGRRINANRVVVIGDTPFDVQCAKAHGCVAFAVATGRYNAAALREAGADVVVEDLRDPSPLLTLLG